ncbi:molecular chaperone GrpE [Rhizobiales bacterium GAS188]|nr:molecular chaperone GrpE [Rhizobiales bacterium GAS188]
MAGEDEKPQTFPAEAGGAPEGGFAADAATSTEDVVAKLEQEKTDLKDKLLRSLAEMENLRRRTEREIADTRSYAVTGFARDMLSVADNLRRAIDTIPGEARKGADGAFAGLIEGIELTERELIKTLERHGVRRVDPAGQKFDPNLHQAMFEAPHDSLAKGQVHTVVQPGYAIGERVLRPALVGVSSGTAANEAGKQRPNGAEAG